MRRHVFSATFIAAAVLALAAHVHGQGRGGPGGPPAGPAPNPRAAAPIDLSGYWVSFVTEDWRYRMLTPPKGDYIGVPLTAEGRRVADAWDPAADEAAGNQCKSYGAAAIMRVPGRLHITWQDDNVIKVDTEAGTQTRLLRFGPAQAASGEPTWQGSSAAEWEVPGGRGRGGRGGGLGAPGTPPEGGGPPTGGPGGPAAGGRGGPPPPRFGSLKVLTTNMRAGYLRKNGVPYGENAVVTEYFELAPQSNSAPLLLVTTIVQDARFLQQPYILTSVFKKQADASGWAPTPCSAAW